MDSIHGNALLKMGLIVAPSCDDCHGVHNIKRAVDRDSPINHANVAKTCGKCHLGIEQTYDKSIHGQLLAKGDQRGPVCIDCHSAHEIVNPTGNNFKAISDERCGKCHQDRLEGYRDTYHGKAMALGRPNSAPEVAACYDCHGFHDILPPSNPAVASFHKQHSRHLPEMSSGRDGKIHRIPAARESAGREELSAAAPRVSGDDRPAHRHVQLLRPAHARRGWCARSGCICTIPKPSARRRSRRRTGDEWFTRFVPFERLLHILVVSSFLLLVVTGMPLKFYYTGWAKFIFSVFGGPETARMLHRFGAIITFLYFTLHLTSLVGKTWKGRKNLRNPATGKIEIKRLWSVLFGPDSMVPTLQDWRDLVDHNKWFFGKGPKPQFDRWTYWEKFDYFAVFWGVAIIGASGLIMWFPEFFTRFLPGWVINIALILAFGRGAAGGGIHLLHPLFQHAFPHREIPDGHRHLLRPRVQDGDAARTPALV